MRKIKAFAIPPLTAIAFALGGCDSAAENQVEEQAEAIDESFEAEAAIEESLAQGAPNEEAIEEYADNLREEGEEIKDDLEDAADQMDEDPQ